MTPHFKNPHFKTPHFKNPKFQDPKSQKKKLNSSAQRASYHNDKMEITQKLCKIFKRFVSQKPGTNSKNARKKKSREFPLGGPCPCGKAGLASCRQSTVFSLFGCFFCFWPNLQNPNHKIHQNPRSKTRPPKSPPQKK